MWRPPTPCSGVSASCSPRTVRGSTPRISARTAPGSRGPASVASRARGCSARRRARWGSTSGARRPWATAPATSSRPAPSGGAASWWRRARGARTSRRRASSARPSCATSLRPWTRLCGRPSGRRFRFVTAVRRPALLLVAVALGTRGLAGQTPLRIGQSIPARLPRGAGRLGDSPRYKLSTFDARLGDTVSADMSSDDLDANLILTDASGNPLARNDDAGGACNAHLSFVMPAAGTYELFANSSSPGELGDFTVSLVQGVTAAARDTTCRGFGRVKGVIQVGQTVKGQLTAGDPLLRADSSYYQRWVLPLEAGRTVTVDLASDDFDSYLLVTRGRGQKLVENDDGGGGCNARVVYAATDDHPVRLVVNSAGKLQTGHFTLRVADGARPLEPKGRCRFTLSLSEGHKDRVSDECRPPRPSRPAASGDGQGAHTIAVGQAIEGVLTGTDHLRPRDSTYSQSWTIAGTAGQVVTVDLESAAFDPYLFVAGPGIGTSLHDDGSGGNCHAPLTLTLPPNGDYRIQVDNSSQHGTGALHLN